MKGHEVVSKLWMVDLGGSERLLKTGATGQTMDEGKAINLSLSALGDVIAALKKKHGHIPFRYIYIFIHIYIFYFHNSPRFFDSIVFLLFLNRNSKLTQLLSDSLGAFYICFNKMLFLNSFDL